MSEQFLNGTSAHIPLQIFPEHFPLNIFPWTFSLSHFFLQIFPIHILIRTGTKYQPINSMYPPPFHPFHLPRVSINQSIKVFLEWPLSGTATARSTAGVNVSNKSQETIDRIDVFQLSLESWQRLSGDNVVR